MRDYGDGAIRLISVGDRVYGGDNSSLCIRRFFPASNGLRWAGKKLIRYRFKFVRGKKARGGAIIFP